MNSPFNGQTLEKRFKDLKIQLESSNPITLKIAWQRLQEAMLLEETAQKLESDFYEECIRLRIQARQKLGAIVKDQDPQEVEGFLKEREKALRKLLQHSDLNVKAQTLRFYEYRDEILWLIRVAERSQGILPENPINSIGPELTQIEKRIRFLDFEGWDTLKIHKDHLATQEALIHRQIEAYLAFSQEEREKSDEGLWAMFERAYYLLKKASFLLKEPRLSEESRTLLQEKYKRLSEVKDDLVGIMEAQSDLFKETWMTLFYEYTSSIQAKVEEESLPQAIHTLNTIPEKIKDVERFCPGLNATIHQKKIKRLKRYFQEENLEKKLQFRLENLFGKNFVSFFENLILFLILMVILLLFVEWKYADFFKNYPLFPLSLEYQKDLDQRLFPKALYDEFQKQGYTLPDKVQVKISHTGTEWHLFVEDQQHPLPYSLHKRETEFRVFEEGQELFRHPFTTKELKTLEEEKLSRTFSRLLKKKGILFPEDQKVHKIPEKEIWEFEDLQTHKKYHIEKKIAEIEIEQINTSHFFMIYIDTFICFIFLLEFFTKMFLSSHKFLYFRKHFFFDFLPSIPFGLFHLAEARFVRLGRLARIFRFIRIARPFIRMARLFFLMVRILDRLVKKYGSLLNRNVIFFQKDLGTLEKEKTTLQELYDLQNRTFRKIQAGLNSVPEEEQLDILDQRLIRLNLLLKRAQLGSGVYKSPLDEGKQQTNSRDIPVDVLVQELVLLDDTRIQDVLDPEVITTLGRYLRYFNIPLFRHLPLIRDIVHDHQKHSDAQIIARTGRVVGYLFERVLSMVYFVADFRGVVTPQQLLDRVGRTIVNATKKPAVRLLLLGFCFLAIQALVQYLEIEILQQITEAVGKNLGTPVIILGSICVVPLVFGVWFTSIAGQATFFYQQVSEAQFINLLKETKLHHYLRDIHSIYKRVFASQYPESEESQRVAYFVESLQSHLALPSEKKAETLDSPEKWPEAKMVFLLYADYLDGAILHRSDTKTSEQLLGNLTLDSIKRHRLRYSRKDLKKMDKLDLGGSVKSFFGPQLCFNFIVDSLAQRSARLLVEYNTHCFPQDWLEHISPKERESMENWLQSKMEGASHEEIQNKHQKEFIPEGYYRTNDFNTLHFLTAQPARDQFILNRYGDAIFNLLRIERRSLFRNIFGTYPLHLLPPELRTLNFYQLYQEHFARGKFLLTPYYLLKNIFRLLRVAFITLYQAVRVILNPSLDMPDRQLNQAGFYVAIRHINRMRKPAFMEALKMRSLFDYEFLGLETPGYSYPLYFTVNDDLHFIGANSVERSFYLELIRTRETQLVQFSQFLKKEKLIGDSFEKFLRTLVGGEKLVENQEKVLRAFTTAYLIDYHHIASTYKAHLELHKFFENFFSSRNLTRISIKKYKWFRHLFFRKRKKILFEQCLPKAYQQASPQDRKKCLKEFLKDREIQKYAIYLVKYGGLPKIMEHLKEIAQHWEMWNQQLLSLRTVQTLAKMDVQNYREIIFQLGDYSNPLPDLSSDPLSDPNVFEKKD